MEPFHAAVVDPENFPFVPKTAAESHYCYFASFACWDECSVALAFAAVEPLLAAAVQCLLSFVERWVDFVVVVVVAGLIVGRMVLEAGVLVLVENLRDFLIVCPVKLI